MEDLPTRHSRGRYGIDNPSSIFSEATVRKIRKEYTDTIPNPSQRSLAKKYKCGVNTMRKLLCRITYIYVLDEEPEPLDEEPKAKRVPFRTGMGYALEPKAKVATLRADEYRMYFKTQRAYDSAMAHAKYLESKGMRKRAFRVRLNIEEAGINV